MRYVGMDVHRNWCQVAEIDDGGAVLREMRLPMDPTALAKFAQTNWDEETQVLVEATGNSHLVYDVVSPYVGKVLLADPNRLKVISQAKVKTDRLDALMLARLLRADMVPEVWVPEPDLRRLGCLVRHRVGLRRTASSLKNQVHAVLKRNGVQVPMSDAFGKAGQVFLMKASSRMPEEDRAIVLSCLSLLGCLEQEMEALERALALRAKDMPEVRILLSIPGVDVYSAVLILTEIGDVSRFPSPKHLASYAGLAPRVHASGERSYTGHISKKGRKHLRWILGQVIQHAVRKPGRLQAFYLRLRQRKGTSVAKVAAARKLLTLIWAMLRTGCLYRDADLRLHRTKETAMERRAAPYPAWLWQGNRQDAREGREAGITAGGT